MKSLKKGNILLIVIILVLIAGGAGYVVLKNKTSPKNEKIEETNMPSDNYTSASQLKKETSKSPATATVKKSSSSKAASAPKAGTAGGGTTGTTVNTGTIEQLGGDIDALLNTSDPTSDLTEPDLDVNLGL